ncbi:MAG: RelA/SpoT family protein [Minisyncoccia bacterium]
MATIPHHPFSELKPFLKDKKLSEIALIEKAYHFAKKAHEGQERKNGEPYFNHVFACAKNVAELNMDTHTICAAMLHDVLEDCPQVTEEIFKKEFGDDITFLVHGVTKLGKLKYQGVERHVESLRKFFVAMSKDIRVVIIKLADRLHNIQTLEFVKKEKQKRIALETLEIHARLADRLGIAKLKGELEDYAFPYAYPEDYKEVVKLTHARKREDELYVQKMFKKLKRKLAEEKINNSVSYRVKHLFSLWQKLKRYDMDINKIYDLTAVRIIVDSTDECYRALGVIHKNYRPIPGRIKDYIAVPKPNGYQSLHTTIFTGDGGTVEIQIRTQKMHDEAELGIASHLSYKEVGKENIHKTITKNTTWVQQLTRWQKDIGSHELMDLLKAEVFEKRVFVLTPKGEVIDLPQGATPIDFAYAIHSDVGRHISSAKVNGKIATLSTPLTSSDIVEIETKESAKPSRKWLEYVKTNDARRHIQNFLEGK